MGSLYLLHEERKTKRVVRKVVILEPNKSQQKEWSLPMYTLNESEVGFYTYIGDDPVPDCDLVCSIVRVNLKQDTILSSLNC
jgi:hypothetical protein